MDNHALQLVYHFFHFFSLLTILLISIAGIVLTASTRPFPGRAWLIVAFACTTATGFSEGMQVLAWFFMNPHEYVASFEVFRVIDTLVAPFKTISVASLLVATIFLTSHFRRATQDPSTPLIKRDAEVSTEIKTKRRTNLLIGLAIGSMVFWPLAFVVRVMAGGDLKKIKAGELDPQGKKAAETIYLIAVIVSLMFVGLLIAVGFVAIYAFVF